MQTGHNEWIMELFHGPTLAFKDFALQFLGNLLDYTLEKRNQKVVIMGATSGDTGSAAIEGCRRCEQYRYLYSASLTTGCPMCSVGR